MSVVTGYDSLVVDVRDQIRSGLLKCIRIKQKKNNKVKQQPLSSSLYLDTDGLSAVSFYHFPKKMELASDDFLKRVKKNYATRTKDLLKTKLSKLHADVRKIKSADELLVSYKQRDIPFSKYESIKYAALTREVITDEFNKLFVKATFAKTFLVNPPHFFTANSIKQNWLKKLKSMFEVKLINPLTVEKVKVPIEALERAMTLCITLYDKLFGEYDVLTHHNLTAASFFDFIQPVFDFVSSINNVSLQNKYNALSLLLTTQAKLQISETGMTSFDDVLRVNYSGAMQSPPENEVSFLHGVTLSKRVWVHRSSRDFANPYFVMVYKGGDCWNQIYPALLAEHAVLKFAVKMSSWFPILKKILLEDALRRGFEAGSNGEPAVDNVFQIVPGLFLVMCYILLDYSKQGRELINEIMRTAFNTLFTKNKNVMSKREAVENHRGLSEAIGNAAKIALDILHDPSFVHFRYDVMMKDVSLLMYLVPLVSSYASRVYSSRYVVVTTCLNDPPTNKLDTSNNMWIK